MGDRQVRHVLIVGVAALALLAAAPAQATHRGTAPPSPGCAQAAETPLHGGVYLDGEPNALAVGARCRYTSTAVGGYRAVAGDEWRVVVDRSDGRRVVYASVLGSSACADDVIRPGDVVTVASDVAVVAGRGVGC